MWLSNNQIEKLEGLTPCIKLVVLFMSNNRIKAWEEIAKLAQLQELRRLLLRGNPCYGEKSVDDAAPYVVKRCP